MNSVLNAASGLLAASAMLVFYGFGLVALFVDLGVFYKLGGIIGLIGGIIIGPLALFAAPFIAIFHFGDWFPLLITYGPLPFAGVLYLAGESLSR